MKSVIRLSDVEFDNSLLSQVAGLSKVNTLEKDAAGHWILQDSFLKSRLSFTGPDIKLLEQPLLEPSYTSTGAVIDSGSTIDTGFEFNNEMTLVAAFKMPSGNTLPLGMLGAATSGIRYGRDGLPMDKGMVIFTNSGSVYFNTFPSGLNFPVAIPADTWVFAAIGVDPTGTNIFVSKDGGNVTFSGGGITRGDGSSHNISIGNYDYVGGYNDPGEIGEIMIFHKLLSQLELQALFTRTKTRMAQRGITLVGPD